MKGFLRVWEEVDLKAVEKHLIVVGELSSECFSCRKVDIGLKVKKCPNCGTEFKYMGFRRKIRISFLREIREESPRVVFIDFDDFKKALGKRDARKILNI